MLKNLFSSEIRVKLLNQFLLYPENEYYLRELTKKFRASPRSIQIELKNLENIELIQKRISGNQHYYSANKQHPIFNDLQNIFIKTMGLIDVLKRYFSDYKKDIHFAFVYGSLSKGNASAGSDVDVMIIGDVKSRLISGDLAKVAQELGREVNHAIFPLSEFCSRLKKDDHFLMTVFKEPKLFIMGNEDEFTRVAEEWLVKNT